MRRLLVATLLAPILISGCGTVSTSAAQDPTSVSISRDTYPSIPVLKRLKNGNYRVKHPWTVHVGGQNWMIQKGYTCNGITATKMIKKSLGDGVEHPETWAAVFHDWLFTQPGVSRATADRLFYELLIAYKVSPIEARAMYSYVVAYSFSKTHL